jgi:hypothetical protein
VFVEDQKCEIFSCDEEIRYKKRNVEGFLEYVGTGSPGFQPLR